MILNRRKLITGLVSFVAAPTIVRAESLMPVRALKPLIWNHVTLYVDPLLGRSGVAYGWKHDAPVKTVQEALDKAYELPKTFTVTIQLAEGNYTPVGDGNWGNINPIIIKGA